MIFHKYLRILFQHLHIAADDADIAQIQHPVMILESSIRFIFIYYSVTPAEQRKDASATNVPGDGVITLPRPSGRRISLIFCQ